jgi:MFS family permease
MAMSWLGNYGVLLRSAGAPRLVAGHLLARLPTGIASVALLYTASRSHLASPGLAIAAYAVSVAATTIVTSRLTDRRGLRGVLVGAAALTFLGMAALLWRPDTAVFLVGAALLGTAFTPVGNGLRLSLLSPDLSETSRVAGNAYETIVMEIGSLAGPAVAGLLIAAGAIDAGFVAIGLGALVGVTVMLSSPLLRQFDASVRSTRSQRSVPLVPSAPSAMQPARARYFDLYRGGMWVVPLVAMIVTTALSAAEVGLFVAGSARWDATTAGLLVALTSAGSLVGGLVFGARAPRTAYTRLGTFFCAYTVLGLAALGLALHSGSLAPTIAAALLAQLAVAPLVVVLARVIPTLAPPERVGEAYGLLSLGAFSGAVLGGLVSTVGVGVAVFGPAVGAAVAAAVLFSRLARLAPRTAGLSAHRVIDITDRARAAATAVAAAPATTARPIRDRPVLFARFGWFHSPDHETETAEAASSEPADEPAPTSRAS